MKRLAGKISISTLLMMLCIVGIAGIKEEINTRSLNTYTLTVEVGKSVIIPVEQMTGYKVQPEVTYVGSSEKYFTVTVDVEAQTYTIVGLQSTNGDYLEAVPQFESTAGDGSVPDDVLASLYTLYICVTGK